MVRKGVGKYKPLKEWQFGPSVGNAAIFTSSVKCAE